jgi:hypothetical protein
MKRALNARTLLHTGKAEIKEFNNPDMYNNNPYFGNNQQNNRGMR